MNIEYKLLENGLDFVLSSANNLKQLADVNEASDKKRMLKYSLLHLFSGIELILKYRLLQEHWSYVYADMNNANKQSFLTGDFQSASSEVLFLRLNALCGIEIKQHHKNEVNKLKELRNKIMHFEIAGNVFSFEGHINKNITFIVQFISEHLKLGEFSSEELTLLSEIKSVLKETTQQYKNAIVLANAEVKERGFLPEQLDTCIECDEQFLLMKEGEAECIFCGAVYDGEALARQYLYNQGISEYSTVKDGGTFPCYDCPECGRNAFIISYDNDFARCFCCEVQYAVSEVGMCSWCNEPYIKYDEEDDIDLCSDCIQYKLEKD